jgi:hypothetical protein
MAGPRLHRHAGGGNGASAPIVAISGLLTSCSILFTSLLGLNASIGSSMHDRKSARRRLIRVGNDPRAWPYNMHTSWRGAFGGQKVSVLTRRKQSRTTAFTEQTRIAALRAGRDCFLLREFRGPRLLPPCWNPCFPESTQDPDGRQCPWRPCARPIRGRGQKRNRGMPN